MNTSTIHLSWEKDISSINSDFCISDVEHVGTYSRPQIFFCTWNDVRCLCLYLRWCPAGDRTARVANASLYKKNIKFQHWCFSFWEGSSSQWNPSSEKKQNSGTLHIGGILTWAQFLLFLWRSTWKMSNSKSVAICFNWWRLCYWWLCYWWLCYQWV